MIIMMQHLILCVERHCFVKVTKRHYAKIEDHPEQQNGVLKIELIDYCGLTIPLRFAALHRVLLRIFRELGISDDVLDLYYKADGRLHKRKPNGEVKPVNDPILEILAASA